MKIITILIVVLALFCTTGLQAQDVGAIGIYTDPDLSECSMPGYSGSWSATVYIMFLPNSNGAMQLSYGWAWEPDCYTMPLYSWASPGDTIWGFNNFPDCQPQEWTVAREIEFHKCGDVVIGHMYVVGIHPSGPPTWHLHAIDCEGSEYPVRILNDFYVGQSCEVFMALTEKSWSAIKSMYR